jgi:phosphoribosylformylglycinamidine cyclo-ligase
VGVAEKSALINGRSIAPGDRVLGLASNGVHSNGYSLVRKILERVHGSVQTAALQAECDGRSLADALMAPTRIYVKPIHAVLQHWPLKGMAHITGGGLLENVPRILPQGCQAVLQRDAWVMPPLFAWLQQHGAIADSEMHRVFNCGIGLVLVVAAEHAAGVLAELQAHGEQAWAIGTIEPCAAGAAPTVVV